MPKRKEFITKDDIDTYLSDINENNCYIVKHKIEDGEYKFLLSKRINKRCIYRRYLNFKSIKHLNIYNNYLNDNNLDKSFVEESNVYNIDIILGHALIDSKLRFLSMFCDISFLFQCEYRCTCFNCLKTI